MHFYRLSLILLSLSLSSLAARAGDEPPPPESGFARADRDACEQALAAERDWLLGQKLRARDPDQQRVVFANFKSYLERQAKRHDRSTHYLLAGIVVKGSPLAFGQVLKSLAQDEGVLFDDEQFFHLERIENERVIVTPVAARASHLLRFFSRLEQEQIEIYFNLLNEGQKPLDPKLASPDGSLVTTFTSSNRNATLVEALKKASEGRVMVLNEISTDRVLKNWVVALPAEAAQMLLRQLPPYKHQNEGKRGITLGTRAISHREMVDNWAQEMKKVRAGLTALFIHEEGQDPSLALLSVPVLAHFQHELTRQIEDGGDDLIEVHFPADLVPALAKTLGPVPLRELPPRSRSGSTKSSGPRRKRKARAEAQSAKDADSSRGLTFYERFTEIPSRLLKRNLSGFYNPASTFALSLDQPSFLITVRGEPYAVGLSPKLILESSTAGLMAYARAAGLGEDESAVPQEIVDFLSAFEKSKGAESEGFPYRAFSVERFLNATKSTLRAMHRKKQGRLLTDIVDGRKERVLLLLPVLKAGEPEAAEGTEEASPQDAAE